MTEESDQNKISEESEKSAAPQSGSKADKKAKAPKTEKEKRLERILTVCLIVAVLAFIYQVFHRIQVVKEAADPHSPNAELGRRQAMELDERMFQARPVVPLAKESAVMHERDDVAKGTGVKKTVATGTSAKKSGK